MNLHYILLLEDKTTLLSRRPLLLAFQLTRQNPCHGDPRGKRVLLFRSCPTLIPPSTASSKLAVSEA